MPASPPDRVIDVAVGVIERPDGQVLLARRPEGKPYAGYWEFPGGKVEPGEPVADALARELHEELGLSEVRSVPWITVRHHYPHATVRLLFRRVRHWQGEAQAREAQLLAWRHPASIELQPLLPASIRPIRWLQLPEVYRISCAGEWGVRAFERLLDEGLSACEADTTQARDRRPLWLQLREPDLSPSELQRLFERLWHWRMHRPLRLIVSSRHPAGLWTQADGVHLTSKDLAALAARPALPWVFASCHDTGELEQAAALGCDLAVLGPVLPTRSHPGASTLGWERFEQTLSDSLIPVMALGGLSQADRAQAQSHGAQGVALMRGGWPVV
jgi:8-oxo-dGTP diphosphatase